MFPLINFLILFPSVVFLIPTPLESKTYFFTPPCTSGRIGVPDLSLPPVIFILPPAMPITEESIISPIFEPSNGLAALSFNSWEILLPLLSETTSLK
jgi:hypothetical protein